MNNYKDAIEQVLNRYEGKGLSDHANDRGGRTYRGISERWYKKWGGWEIIDTHGPSDSRLDGMVIDFYRKYYWDALSLDDVEDQFISQTLFNFSINIGTKSAIKKVQRIVVVSVDGVIGPITLNAINKMDRDIFMFQFILEVVDLYHHIVSKDRSQKVFLLGWVGRALSTYQEYEHYKKLNPY